MAQAMTLLEERHPDSLGLLASLYDHRQGALVVGITGPPGAGKSTLISAMIKELRVSGKTVGVIAVDPSSPLTGGALLGDRIRMTDHATDKGVFVRSLASRGSHGGLARVTRDAVILLDACGFDWVVIETVGVGQGELDIAGLAETTVLVLVPQAGDTIQTMKAGIMEIADIFVINKSDRDGAEELAQDIRLQCHAPVVLATAHLGQGIGAILEAVGEHQKAVADDVARAKRRQHVRSDHFLEILRDALFDRAREHVEHDKKLRRLAQGIASGEQNPYRALEEVLKDV